VTREEVVEALGQWLRVEYGKLLVPRVAKRARRAAGGAWDVTVVIPAKAGDVFVAEVEVNEEGVVERPLEIEDILAAARRPIEKEAAPEGAGFDPFADASDEVKGLMDLADDEDDAPPMSAQEGTPEAIYARAQALLKAGDPAALQKARSLMPRLLSEPEKRGAVLVWMAVIERKLQQIPLALGYLEAAAREFADRFDLSALEKAAAVAQEMMGAEAFAGSPIDKLVEQSRSRLEPVKDIFESPQFFAATEAQRKFLAEHLTLRTLQPRATLVKEGEPSRAIFIIKSGLIGVYLEKAEGGDRLVRCCFPGWLLGESSVLVEGDPRCTATLRAERASEVWTIDAQVLKQVMAENENLRYRLAATKQIHRIDSFFSMHESISQLDVTVRDELLGCIQKVQSFDVDTTVLEAGAPPDVACLVAKGEIVLYPPGKTEGEHAGVLAADRFLGVRDAMHAIPPGLTAVARAGSTIAFLHAGLLRALAERSPEHVIAVLERLG
jgi:CRP-like cAMP-binding protein